MSNKPQLNGETDQINMSFTLTDDSESIIISGSDQNNIVYNIDYINDSSLPQSNFQQYIEGSDNIFAQHNISSIQEQSTSYESKKHHQTQITFGKGLPTCEQLNSQQLFVNNSSNKSQFKNYKQYVVSKEKIFEDKKMKVQAAFVNSKSINSKGEVDSMAGLSTTTKKENSSVMIMGNAKLDKLQSKSSSSNQHGTSTNINNNNSQSNLRSSTTHDETQSTNVMTCMLDKTQADAVEYLKKQLIFLQSEYELTNSKLIEREEEIKELKRNQVGLREGLTVRDYEQTISKQAIELIQLRQMNEQIQKENKQLQQEIVKNKAESFQKYEDLKQNNEELLEVYEEKFKCQLQLVKDNFLKQISALEQKSSSDEILLKDLKQSNLEAQSRIHQLEIENEKLLSEKEQLFQQNIKYSDIARFLDASQMQYIYALSKNLSPQNVMLLNQNSYPLHNIPNVNGESIVNNINNNFSTQQLNLIQNLNNNQNSSNDTQKTHPQQSTTVKERDYSDSNDIQNQESHQKLDFRYQSPSVNKSAFLQVKSGKDQSPENNRIYPGKSNLNKSQIKLQRQLLTPQSQQIDNQEYKNQNGNPVKKNQCQSIVSESQNEEKSNDLTPSEQEISFITKSQKQQQQQFQLQLGQAQVAQQSLLYSQSTQVTKRNHYLQQNISHRHYPSQINSNQNMSHNKSCERYGSPLSYREHNTQHNNNQQGLNSSQLYNQSTQNIHNSNAKSIQKKPSTKNLNSSNNNNNGIQESHIFQHETIKGILSAQQISGVPPSMQINSREKELKNTSKYIQAKKKKGINSQEQRSFYNTINTSQNSNSLLIQQSNKTHDFNTQGQKQHSSKSKFNSIENPISKQLSDSISHDKLKQVLDEQKSIISSASIKNLQKMTKSLSNQSLINAQTHIQGLNLSKLNISNAQATQVKAQLLKQQLQTQSSQENNETFSPRIHTSRSTNSMRNNQTFQKNNEKHQVSQQSDIFMESPNSKIEERSASNSTYKYSDCEDQSNNSNMKLYKMQQNNNNQQKQQGMIGKQQSQISKANIYSKIKNQIIQQQLQQNESTHQDNITNI